jgi:hypothetical protein
MYLSVHKTSEFLPFLTQSIDAPGFSAATLTEIEQGPS